MYSSRAAKNPNEGRRSRAGCRAAAPRPARCPTPKSPGGLQYAERERVNGDDHERARALRDRREPLQVLHRAEEVRLLEEDGRGLVVDRAGERVRVGCAVVERHLDDLGAEAAR